MADLGLHKNKTTTVILNKLSSAITRLNKNDSKVENARARSCLNELKLRSRYLTATQKEQHKRLLDRYSWI